MNLRVSLGANIILGTVFISSGGITSYGMETEKETTTTVVLGHGICSGEGGSFIIIRFGEKCMKVNP
jgi:hypothetical protein